MLYLGVDSLTITNLLNHDAKLLVQVLIKMWATIPCNDAKLEDGELLKYLNIRLASKINSKHDANAK